MEVEPAAPPADAPPAAAAGSEETQEEPECRICRGEATQQQPLFHPCKCSGSMRWVHQACLMQWIQMSNNARRCEICGVDFRYEPVYLPGTPSKLPVHELLLGLSVRSARLARLCLRVRAAAARALRRLGSGAWRPDAFCAFNAGAAGAGRVAGRRGAGHLLAVAPGVRAVAPRGRRRAARPCRAAPPPHRLLVRLGALRRHRVHHPGGVVAARPPARGARPHAPAQQRGS